MTKTKTNFETKISKVYFKKTKPSTCSIFSLKSDKKWKDFVVLMGQQKNIRLLKMWIASHFEKSAEIGKKKPRKWSKLDSQSFSLVYPSSPLKFFSIWMLQTILETDLSFLSKWPPYKNWFYSLNIPCSLKALLQESSKSKVNFIQMKSL